MKICFDTFSYNKLYILYLFISSTGSTEDEYMKKLKQHQRKIHGNDSFNLNKINNIK